MPKRTQVASSPRYISPKTFKHIASPKSLSLKRWPTGEIAFFLLKVAAPEAVQRLSGAGVHLYGRLLRHFNVFAIHHSYGFGDGHPLGYWSKVHSIHTDRKSQDHYCFSPSHQLSLFISKKTIHTQPHCESSSRPSTSDMRNCDESPKDALSGSWLVQLFRELEKQGITLPESFSNRTRDPAFD